LYPAAIPTITVRDTVSGITGQTSFQILEAGFRQS
jgi:hypothetical protein